MVDVSAKPATERVAVAEGRVVMRRRRLPSSPWRRQEGRRSRHGADRRHLGSQAHPRIDSAVPPLLLSQIEVDLVARCRAAGHLVTARVKVAGKTGVEMEALTAVSVACLTIYDMVKAVERGMRIEGIRLVEKRGGSSGHYRAKE